MLNSLWKKFLILLFITSMISLSAAFLLRELIIRDFREYLEGEMEDRVYWVTEDQEGKYEEYSGWKEGFIVEDTIWALMLGMDIKIFDENGALIMDTGKALDSIPELQKRRVLAISDFRPEEKSEGPFPYPLFHEGKEIGRLEVRFLPPEKETLFIKRSNQFLFLSLLALGGISVILSIIFSRKLTDPLKRLTHAAKSISGGNLTSRVEISGNDEITRLADSFNRMAHSLEIQESLRKKLTSNIAHELRTPLAVMRGEVEGMIDGLIPSDKRQLLSLYEETGRLKKILEGIEELSAAEASAVSLRKQSIQLKPFLRNMTGRFIKLFLDKGVILELDCDSKVTIDAGPDKLSQVVMNLLSNALKATGEGGRVRIKVVGKETGAMIEIQDTGSGIKEEDLPFVFERFFKGSQGGLGLGLAISKELVEAHDGKIEVTSVYGKGSVFSIYFPSSNLHNFS